MVLLVDNNPQLTYSSSGAPVLQLKCLAAGCMPNRFCRCFSVWTARHLLTLKGELLGVVLSLCIACMVATYTHMIRVTTSHKLSACVGHLIFVLWCCCCCCFVLACLSHVFCSGWPSVTELNLSASGGVSLAGCSVQGKPLPYPVRFCMSAFWSPCSCLSCHASAPCLWCLHHSPPASLITMWGWLVSSKRASHPNQTMCDLVAMLVPPVYQEAAHASPLLCPACACCWGDCGQGWSSNRTEPCGRSEVPTRLVANTHLSTHSLSFGPPTCPWPAGRPQSACQACACCWADCGQGLVSPQAGGLVSHDCLLSARLVSRC